MSEDSTRETCELCELSMSREQWHEHVNGSTEHDEAVEAAVEAAIAAKAKSKAVAGRPVAAETDKDRAAKSADRVAALAAVPAPKVLICELLTEIEKNDTDYSARYELVFELMHVAQTEPYGYETGIRIDPNEPGWPVFWVVLPGVGEVSWHMPSYEGHYDRCGTEVKYARIKQYIANAGSASA